MASEQRFSIVKKTLESHGWVLARISGSHHIFTKPGRTPISIPVHHNKVNPVYVQRVQKLLEKDASEEDA